MIIDVRQNVGHHSFVHIKIKQILEHHVGCIQRFVAVRKPEGWLTNCLCPSSDCMSGSVRIIGIPGEFNLSIWEIIWNTKLQASYKLHPWCSDLGNWVLRSLLTKPMSHITQNLKKFAPSNLYFVYWIATQQFFWFDVLNSLFLLLIWQWGIEVKRRFINDKLLKSVVNLY